MYNISSLSLPTCRSFSSSPPAVFYTLTDYPVLISSSLQFGSISWFATAVRLFVHLDSLFPSPPCLILCVFGLTLPPLLLLLFDRIAVAK
ncbi:hypothetical protein LZ32DRAFT_353293 [Colletotrichum eremochloae]|nr:hypothetical protein LZ32DRAFT_353293 [Colletotrichum eremochloae]